MLTKSNVYRFSNLEELLAFEDHLVELGYEFQYCIRETGWQIWKKGDSEVQTILYLEEA